MAHEEEERWRFFTKVHAGDSVVIEHWCWDQRDPENHVIDAGSGFNTRPAAIEDARRHGYTGDVDAEEGRHPSRRFDDLAPSHYAFDWLNTGLQTSVDTPWSPSASADRRGAQQKR